jgi:hypothetical protein
MKDTTDAPVPDARSSGFVDPQDELIGETYPTPRGYSLSVYSIRFDNEGKRVRLVLRHDAEFVRNFDLTTLLLRDALPILEKAAGLGSCSHETKNSHESYYVKLLRSLGYELRARYSEETVQLIFESAKAAIKTKGPI